MDHEQFVYDLQNAYEQMRRCEVSDNDNATDGTVPLMNVSYYSGRSTGYQFAAGILATVLREHHIHVED